MSSFLYREDGWLRLEKQLVSLGSLIEKWQRGKICQKSLALSPVCCLDKYFFLSRMSNLSLTFTYQICQSCFHIRSHCLFYNKYLIFFPCKAVSFFKSNRPVFIPCQTSVSFPHQIYQSLFHVKSFCHQCPHPLYVPAPAYAALNLTHHGTVLGFRLDIDVSCGAIHLSPSLPLPSIPPPSLPSLTALSMPKSFCSLM